MNLRTLLLDSFDAVVQSALPGYILPAHIADIEPPKGRLIVIGAGKAAADMAATFESHYDQGPYEGIVVTRHGALQPTEHIQILHAAHPTPDEGSVKAADAIINLLYTATADDLIINLLSGGGSSLLSAPVDSVSLQEIMTVNTALLKSGAAIEDINIVRKHLNRALGGGLAKICPDTPAITLALSDVVGDDPATIASGPMTGDPTTLADTRNVLEKYAIDAPASIITALNNQDNETPSPHDPIFTHKDYRIIACAKNGITAAETFWQQQGYDTHSLSTDMTGSTQEAAKAHIDKLLTLRATDKPMVLLSGGELTVKVTGEGKGGPNTDFLLHALMLLKDTPHPQSIYALAADTDGIDGNGDHAGAILTPDSLRRAKDLMPQHYADTHNSYGFFEAVNGLVITGTLQTNINDYRAFIIVP